jgi:hypothetical protein
MFSCTRLQKKSLISNCILFARPMRCLEYDISTYIIFLCPPHQLLDGDQYHLASKTFHLGQQGIKVSVTVIKSYCYMYLRKPDGELYKAMSLESIRQELSRHLKSPPHNKSFDIV